MFPTAVGVRMPAKSKRSHFIAISLDHRSHQINDDRALCAVRRCPSGVVLHHRCGSLSRRSSDICRTAIYSSCGKKLGAGAWRTWGTSRQKILRLTLSSCQAFKSQTLRRDDCPATCDICRAYYSCTRHVRLVAVSDFLVEHTLLECLCACRAILHNLNVSCIFFRRQPS